MHTIFSNSTDVYHNLAVEDALLDDESIEIPVVFVYRNDDAVVLGKNQNPWRECSVHQLDELGVRLSRRVTGGGTVFHDGGNLNVSLILPREKYNRSEALSWMMDGLKTFGIEPEIVNDTSIAVNQLKVSGNAFCYRRNRVLHHGTLLWTANLDKLHKALTPSLEGIETRAIASVPMPMQNLTDLLPEHSVEDLQEAVLKVLAKRLGHGPAQEMAYTPDGLDERIKKMKSWKWVYGNTPDFVWKSTDEAGHQAIAVHRGMIQSITGGDPGWIGKPFPTSL